MKNPSEVSRFVREVRVAFKDDKEKMNFAKSMMIRNSEELVQEHKLELESENVSEFLKAVKVVVKDDYGDFIQVMKVMKDYCKSNIDERCFVARVKVLLRGHANLIQEFNTLFLPTRSHITIPPWDQLPWDVLHVITRKLDFYDLFQFSRVCTDWRVVHNSIDKSKFLTSPEALLLEFMNKPVKVPYSFTTLNPKQKTLNPKQKMYPLKKMMINMLTSYSVDGFFPIYVTCSSGYFVIIADNSSILLINPFTRIKKEVICPSTFEFSFSSRHKYRALLAFDKCSDEFVLVFLFKTSNGLHVYRSQNNDWVTYDTYTPHVDGSVSDNIVVDFVAFNNTIYLVTDEARIGVLSLNSANIEFLDMANSLLLERYLHFGKSSFNLVRCDEQLLLVRLNPVPTRASGMRRCNLRRKAYKIDFSTMTFVGLETLGDVALFYVCFGSCKALSNPNRWGYESNCVHEVSKNVNKNSYCMVYNWNTKSKEYIVPPNPKTKNSFIWCFRHLENEVDCSF